MLGSNLWTQTREKPPEQVGALTSELLSVLRSIWLLPAFFLGTSVPSLWNEQYFIPSVEKICIYLSAGHIVSVTEIVKHSLLHESLGRLYFLVFLEEYTCIQPMKCEYKCIMFPYLVYKKLPYILILLPYPLAE